MSSRNTSTYVKIANTLREEIECGVYKKGDLLPTEQKLENRFKSSRITIRNAVGVLEKEGFIEKIQGKGTIIKDIRTTQELNYLTSFTETFEKKGFIVETGNLSVDLIKPPQSIITVLDINKDTNIYSVKRTRIINSEPIAFINNYLLTSVVPKLEDKYEKLYSMGLYHLLEKEYNLRLKYAVEKIRVYLSGPLDSEILQIRENLPLFHTARTTYLEDGTAFEYVITVVKADKMEYTVYLRDRPK